MRTALFAAAALILMAGPAMAQQGPINGGMSGGREIGSGSFAPDTQGPRNPTGEGGGAPLANCPSGGSVSGTPQASQSFECPPYGGSSSLGGTGTGSSAAGTGAGPQPTAPPNR